MKRQDSIIHILTSRSFRQKKGRNTVAVFAILLTAMMFTTLLTLAMSMEKNLTEMYLRQSGTSAHATARDITDEEISAIASRPELQSSGRSIVVGIAENEELAGQQVEIRYGSEQYARDSFAFPTQGRLPEAEDEIALDTLTLKRLGIPQETGQQVTLAWRPDLSSDETVYSTFTLCGWWEGNQSSYASMAWVSEDFALDACGGAKQPAEGQVLGQRMMSITFPDIGHMEEQVASLLSECGLSDLEFNVNLVYSGEFDQMIFQECLPMYLGMILIFAAGWLIIFNVFQISVASDIRFYGELKTLGVTSKQIRKIIYGQGNRLCLIGIPAGLILGYLLGVLLMPVLLQAFGSDPEISANPLIFLGSAIFAYATVILSCLMPARLAGKVSPVEALRYTDAAAADTNIRKKEKKSRRGAGIPEMAWANLWRNRKRTVIIICSLTLGLVLTSFFYARNESFDIEKYLADLAVADYQIDDATNNLADGYDPESDTISETLLSEIGSLDGLEETGSLYSRQITGVLTETARANYASFYTEDRLQEFSSYDPNYPQWKAEYDRALAGEAVPFTIYGADGPVLEAAVSDPYILDGTWDEDAFSTGDYVIAIGPAAEAGTGQPTFSVGETVNIEGRDFTVMAVVSPLQPMVEGTSPVFEVPLILPSGVFTQIWPDSSPRKYYFNVDDESMQEASDLLTAYQEEEAPGMNITSRQTIAEQYEAQTRSSSVMGYAISAIIALVGVLNFINSMITAIISRKREFAMMQSIGMTKRQLKNMLVCEGLFYAGLTLIASYILSSAAVGIVVRAITAGGFSTFRFTLLPLVVCTPLLLLFAVILPHICFRNLEKQSIVERLRQAD